MKNIAKNILQWGIAGGILVLSLWWAFYDIELEAMKGVLSNVNYYIALIPIPIVLFSHWIRAYRWKTFLEPIKKIDSTWNLFSAVMILYAINTVTSRAGEFVRPYVVSKREKISYSSTFGTIILERVVDVITLIIVFGITFLFLSQDIAKVLPANVNPSSIIIISFLIIAVGLLNLYPPFLDFMLRNLLKPISEKFYQKASGIFERFKKGLYILKNPSKYLRIGLLSLLIWVFYALPIYITFFAFDFQNELNLGFVDATMLVIVAGIAVTIAPSPGGAGVYHLFMQKSLVNLYNVDPTTALAFATVVHGISTVTQTVVGFLFFKREGLTSFKIKKDEEDS
ncbi:lysylphosphatidylglycerol synthase transmembrane domain-containing protein [Candidatus Kapabacteria bacterium]|nr:lysylphosphatidylglycerol synthase transmembrane domain-containing protein [Candidatus Kapabacteria bacterium]